MGTIDTYAHGQFCWVDLMARDMATAGPFYEALLGWKVVPSDTQGGPPYTQFHWEGEPVAGMGQMTDEMKATGMPPVWNSYVNVDDVKAATEKAASLGATVVMPPTAVVDAGSMSILRDPTGAHLSLWQKGRHKGAGYVNDPPGLSWNELMTPDVAASQQFYRELFGWTFDKDETPRGVYWTFSNAGRLNGGLMAITPEMQGVPPSWSVYFSVADLDAALGRLTAQSGRVLMPAFEVSVGRIAVVQDAQGATFDLIQMSAPADQ